MGNPCESNDLVILSFKAPGPQGLLRQGGGVRIVWEKDGKGVEVEIATKIAMHSSCVVCRF